MEHIFDIALTLHADHELNASTFAARVTAATLSDIYSAVTSGIGALKGPLHGGANEEVIRMLLEVGTADKAVERVQKMLSVKGVKVPGFGHRVYRTDDPRATHLRVMSEELGKSTGQEDLYLMSKRVEETLCAPREEAQSQRGFLFGLHLLFARHSNRPVHPDFRREPHVRLDRPRA